MSDIKIAFFISGLRPGGISRYVLNLSKGFIKKEFNVDIIIPRHIEAYQNYVPEKANIINLKTGRILKSIFPLVYYLRSNKPDVLFSANDYVNIAAIWAWKMAKVPTKMVSTIHIDRRNIVDDHKIRTCIFTKLVQKAYPLSDYIVAVSEGVSENVSKKYKIPRESIKVIYNPILDEDLQNEMNEKVNHKWYGSDNQTIILGIGRLTQQKDFLNLIKAFKIVRQDRPVKLVILGEGEERKHLQELIIKYGLEDDIDLPGFVQNPYSFMKNANLFVLSSKYEGFGNVIVEAMAAGTPVVSTDCPSGPSEILENGKYGRLVPVGNVTLLAEAIENALNEPADSEALKTRAMDYSIERITEEYARLLNLV